jgi:hypothetical protein
MGVSMSQEEEILALEEKRFAAMVSGDLGALDALLHQDLVYTHSSAVVDTKASYLEAIRTGKTLRLRYLDVWTKTPQGWKFIAWQSTAIPQ